MKKILTPLKLILFLFVTTILTFCSSCTSAKKFLTPMFFGHVYFPPVEYKGDGVFVDEIKPGIMHFRCFLGDLYEDNKNVCSFKFKGLPQTSFKVYLGLKTEHKLNKNNYRQVIDIEYNKWRTSFADKFRFTLYQDQKILFKKEVSASEFVVGCEALSIEDGMVYARHEQLFFYAEPNQSYKMKVEFLGQSRKNKFKLALVGDDSKKIRHTPPH